MRADMGGRKNTMRSLMGASALFIAVTAGPWAAPADAGHCGGIVTPVPSGNPIFYIDDRGGFVGGNGVWIYLESNGVAGLQQGGQHLLVGEDDEDACTHVNPDTLLF
jgi:hypothetical protein